MAGLFDTMGATPDLMREGLALERQKQDQEWLAKSMSGLGSWGSPAMVAANQGAQGAMQVEQGLGKMLGAEDPRIAKASKVKKAVDAARAKAGPTADPEAMYEALTEAFANEGLEQEAMQAAEALNKHKMDKADFDLKKSTAAEKAQLVRERIEAERERTKLRSSGKTFSGLAADYAKSGHYDPESLDKFAETGKFEDLRFKDKENWSEPYFINMDGRSIRVQKNTKTNKEHAVSSGQVINVNNEGKADLQARTDIFKNDYKQHSEQVAAAQRLMPAISTYQQLVKDGNLITGSLAEGRTMLERLGVTLGVRDSKTLNDTELFNKVVMDIVLPKMAMLGGSDSNEELKKLIETTGDQRMHPTTLKRIGELMQLEVDKAMGKHGAFIKHRESGGNPVDFDFLTGKPINPNTVTGEVTRSAKPASEPKSDKKPTVKYTVTPQAVSAYIGFMKQKGQTVTEEQAKAYLEQQAAKRNQ